MAWASTEKVVLGCIAFGVWWILAVFPAVPCLPIGRTAGSLLGAALMVVFQIISPTAAFAAVDLPILGLLFGTMVVSVYLERADLFKYLGNALSWKSRGGKDLLCRVCLLAAVSSALFTNDTTCVVLTEFVLKLCRQKNLPPQPFLIALACSSNIGSAATPIGNPQNLVIAVQSKIGFGKFLIGIIPAVAVGLVVNTLGLLLVYWRRLSGNPSQEEGGGGVPLTNADAGNKEEIPQNDLPSQLSNSDYMGNLSRDGQQPAVDRFTESTNQGFEGLSVLRQPQAKPRGPEIQRRNSDSIVVELASFYRTGRGGEVHLTGFNPMRGSTTSELLGLDSRASVSLPRELGPDETTGLESPDHIAAGILPSPSNVTEGDTTSLERRKKRLWKISVYFVTMGMLAALLAGLSLPWSALTAAVVLMVLDFSDAGPSLDQVPFQQSMPNFQSPHVLSSMLVACPVTFSACSRDLKELISRGIFWCPLILCWSSNGSSIHYVDRNSLATLSDLTGHCVGVVKHPASYKFEHLQNQTRIAEVCP